MPQETTKDKILSLWENTIKYYHDGLPKEIESFNNSRQDFLAFAEKIASKTTNKKENYHLLLWRLTYILYRFESGISVNNGPKRIKKYHIQQHLKTTGFNEKKQQQFRQQLVNLIQVVSEEQKISLIDCNLSSLGHLHKDGFKSAAYYLDEANRYYMWSRPGASVSHPPSHNTLYAPLMRKHDRNDLSLFNLMILPTKIMSMIGFVMLSAFGVLDALSGGIISLSSVTGYFLFAIFTGALGMYSANKAVCTSNKTKFLSPQSQRNFFSPTVALIVLGTTIGVVGTANPFAVGIGLFLAFVVPAIGGIFYSIKSLVNMEKQSQLKDKNYERASPKEFRSQSEQYLNIFHHRNKSHLPFQTKLEYKLSNNNFKLGTAFWINNTDDDRDNPALGELRAINNELQQYKPNGLS